MEIHHEVNTMLSGGPAFGFKNCENTNTASYGGGGGGGVGVSHSSAGIANIPPSVL